MRWLFLLLAMAFAFHATRVMAQTAVAEKEPQAEATKQEKAETSNSSAKSDADQESSELYLRVKQSEEGKPKSLQTAIVRYRGKKGTPFEGRVVDLVGVVHIGQDEYYADLNKRLSKYDSVLYELVAPDGTRIRPEDLESRRSILASMQTGMKDMLNLEYQLEKIDYLSENFRHADMSPEEFVEDLERRGDSLFKMFARMMGAGLASSAASGGDAGVLLALFSNDRSMRMKQAMARQLVDIEIVTAGMDDENGENTLIKGRNAKAFSVLREELDAGKEKLAVFYGAGHLPDMAERLEREFEMSPRRTTWLDAWDLTRN
jgi:hypothetical protein